MVITLPAGVRPGSTVLLLAPRSADAADEACLRLLGGDEPRRKDVVAVAFDRSAGAFIDAWIEHVGVEPADMCVVDVGTGDRSIAAESADPSRSRNVVRSVDDPRDLATVLAGVEELVTEPIASDATRLLYLDSVGLRAVGPQAAFGFLDDVGDLVRRTGCVGFVRVDRGAHSDHAIDVMAALVDAVLEFHGGPGGGSWEVRAGRRAVRGLDSGGSAPSIDDLFGLLSDRRRRLALHHLIEAEEPVATFDLATMIAGNEPPCDERSGEEVLRRIYTGLVHVHLPKLEAHGVVSVDAGGEAIRLREPVERLQPLLALTVSGDLHG